MAPLSVARLAPPTQANAVEVFLDTSAWLSVHRLSVQDAAQLETFLDALDQGHVRLHAPEALVAEYRRQRKALLDHALERTRTAALDLRVPQVLRAAEGETTLLPLEQAYFAERERYLDAVDAQIQVEQLPVDHLIARLLSHAHRAASTRLARRRASERFALCNPPGEHGGLSDALSWETLLATVPEGARLHVVSEAATYCTEGEEERFNGFLLEEFRERTGGDVVLHSRLWRFFSRCYPDVRLADAAQVDHAIEAFVMASNAPARMQAAQTLQAAGDFSPAQIERIFDSVIEHARDCALQEAEEVGQWIAHLAYAQGASCDPHTLEVVRALLYEVDDSDAPP